MTDLSPAARKVFDAADGMKPIRLRGRALAAALRAAANAPAHVPPNVAADDYLAFRIGMETMREHWHAIAHELENVEEGR
jgi:hypothetical protein